MKKARLLSVLLAFAMVFSLGLSGCQEEQTPPPVDNDGSVSESTPEGDATGTGVAGHKVGFIQLTLGTTYHASCFVGINRGAGDSRFVMTVDMICGWLVVLPLTYLAAFVWKLPLPLVFLCTRIDQCFKWIIAMVRLRGDRWIKNVTRP